MGTNAAQMQGVLRPLSLSETVTLSAASAVVAQTTIYPLDLIKSRTQVAAGALATQQGTGGGVLSAARTMIAREGASSLYRGLGPVLAGQVPEKAAKFVVFSRLLSWSTQSGGVLSGLHPAIQEGTCGAAAAAAQVMVSTPYDTLKVKMQTQEVSVGGARLAQPSALSLAQKLGFRRLYRGLSAAAMRDISFNAIYFSSYGEMKRVLAGPDGNVSELGAVTRTAAAGAAAIFPTLLSHPVDTVKTMMQSKGISAREALVRLSESEGGLRRSLYRGLVPRMLVVPPLFGIALGCFETLQAIAFPETAAATSVVKVTKKDMMNTSSLSLMRMQHFDETAHGHGGDREGSLMQS